MSKLKLILALCIALMAIGCKEDIKCTKQNNAKLYLMGRLFVKGLYECDDGTKIEVDCGSDDARYSTPEELAGYCKTVIKKSDYLKAQEEKAQKDAARKKAEEDDREDWNN